MRLLTQLWIASAVAVAACSGGGATDTGGGNETTFPPDPGITPVAAAVVNVYDDYFTPSSVVLAIGGTVTFRWIGTNGHSVTPEGSPTFAPTAGISYPPKELVVTIPTAGTYRYHCIVHGVSDGYGGQGTMVGVIYVR